jgi:photosystem II stability/assembly factor-like uncharacterized protein
MHTIRKGQARWVSDADVRKQNQFIDKLYKTVKNATRPAIFKWRQTAPELILCAPNMISSPDGSISWRIGPGGTIFRSHDNVNWSSQISGVKADLTAGAAISANVCWVVGRGGTILRTLDGEHWQRVTAPTDDDLTLVFADGASAATVVTDRGVRFTTTNGGKTWHSK